jgi:hypothetical protein
MMSTLSFPGQWKPTDAMPEATIETPLGILRLYAQVNGELLDANRAKVFAVGRDAQLFAWNTHLATAELVICKVPEEDYDVLGCYAALWRIRAEKQRITDYSLTCAFLAAIAESEGGSSGGEWLQALEWSDGQTTVIVGTQDEEATALVPGQVPQRWLAADNPKYPDVFDYAREMFVKHTPYGFVLKPPELEPGEVAQFQFVVTWAYDPYEAWAAVNRSPLGILESLSDSSPK